MSTIIEYAGQELDLISIFPPGYGSGLVEEVMLSPLGYLISNGFKQSIADVVAGREKELIALHDRIAEGEYSDPKAKAKDQADIKLWSERLGESESSLRSESANGFAKACMKWLQADRLANIKAGTVGVRSNGPRLDPLTKMVRQIAEETLKAALRGRKANLVPGYTSMSPADAFKSLVDRKIEKDGHIYEVEAKRRLDQAKELASDDLADLGL